MRKLRFLFVLLFVFGGWFTTTGALAVCIHYDSLSSLLTDFPAATSAGTYTDSDLGCLSNAQTDNGLYYNTATQTYIVVKTCTSCTSPAILLPGNATLENGCTAEFNVCGVTCSTTTTKPSGSQATSIDVSHCSSSSTFYATLDQVPNVYWTIHTCNTCQSGYYRYETSYNQAGGGYCSVTYYDCAACTAIPSYGSWSSYSTGYERRLVTYSWNASGCGSTPSSTYEYRCAAGYYGSPTSGSSGCTKCNVSFTNTCSVTNGNGTQTCYHTSSPAGSTSSSACTGTANCGSCCATSCSSGYLVSNCACVADETTITFRSGSYTMTQTCTPGQSVTLKARSNMTAPVSSTYGWAFDGWATGVSSSTITYYDGESITCPDSDTTLYGVWKRDIAFKYYNSSTATSITTDTRTQYFLNTGNTTTTAGPVQPYTLYTQTTYGWTPDGWCRYKTIPSYCVDESPTAIVVVPPANSAHTTYWAVYSRTPQIVYNKNGGTGSMSNSDCEDDQKIVASGTAAAADCTLSNNGFTAPSNSEFSAWALGSTSGTQYDEGETFQYPNTSWTGSQTYNVYAIWATTNVTVSFNLSEGSGTAPASTTCTPGSSCTVITTAERTGDTTNFYNCGHVFLGWYSGGSKLTSNSITTSTSKTYYDEWEECARGYYKTSSAKANASCTAAGNGYYADGTGECSQTQCPSGYRDGSDGGRDQESDCYGTCEKACSGNDTASCPDNATCTYDTDAYSTGTEHYSKNDCDASTILCPVDTITCDTGYHKSGSSCVANTCTITFKTGNTTLGTQTFTTGDSLNTLSSMNSNVPSALKSNSWSFSGWATTYNTAGIGFSNGDDDAAICSSNGTSRTFYGVWSRSITRRRFSSASATSASGSVVGQTYYNTTTSSASPKAINTTALYTNSTYGWAPVGWVNDSSSHDVLVSQTGSSTVSFTPAVDQGATWYAVYTRTPEIVYNANTGSGSMSNSTCNTQYFTADGSGTTPSCTLSDNSFTAPSGKRFSAWAAGSASGTQYAAGASYTFPNTSWTGTKTYNGMYAIWEDATATITVTAGNGKSAVSASGWTGTGGTSMTKTYNIGDTITLSTISGTNKTGYTGTAYSVGGSTITGTYTVTGDATIVVKATGLSDPSPSISSSATKTYSYTATTLTASGGTYDSGVTLNYAFGTSSSLITDDSACPTADSSYTFGTASTTATKSVAKAEYLGKKCYKVKVTATDGTLTSNTVSGPSTPVYVDILKRSVTFDATTNGGTLSGTSPIYASYRVDAKGYTGKYSTTERAIPTATKAGSVFNGWYSAASDGTKIVNSDGTLTSSSVTGLIYGSKWSLTTAAKTVYAQFSACTCTKGSHVASCTAGTVSNNTCAYSFTCETGYNYNGSSTGAFSASGAGVASSTSPDCTQTDYAITVTAGRGVSTVAATGWIGTGTATLSKVYHYGDTIDLTTLVPTNKTGYTGTSYAVTSGSGSISSNTFTVGTGNGTITVTATGISAPTSVAISGGSTKTYNYTATTLTGSQATSYDSGITVYYNFGSTATATSSTCSGSYTYGTASSTATTSVAKDAFRGYKCYKVKVYASDGTLTSSTVEASTATTMGLINRTLTFNVASNSGTISGTSPLYTAYGNGSLYTSATGTTTGSMPSATKSNNVFTGWYTAASSGTKVVNADGTLTGSAVTNYTNASKQWVMTANQTVYAQFGACSCTKGTNVSACTVTGVTSNKCQYSYTCTSGYNNGGSTSGTFEGAAATASNTSPSCASANISGAIALNSNRWASNDASSAASTASTAAAPTPVYSKYNTGIYSNSGATTAVTKLSTNPVMTGYTFAGFYTTKATGGTQVVDASGNFTTAAKTQITAIGGQATWYARWTAQTSTVTLNANGGTAGTTTSVTATYDSAMPVPTNNTHIPTRAGYTFAGFYDTSAATGGTQYYTSAGASARTWNKTGAQTLYARWTQCAANSYCPGDNTTKSCPTGFPNSAVGASANTDCYMNITLNKNGFSFNLAADAGTGCKVASAANGTSNATLKFYYNTACTLPTFSGGTQTGYTSANSWSASNTLDATAVTTIAKTTTAPSTTTYYARKTTCAGDYYKSANTTCSACGSSSYNSAGNLLTTCQCYPGFTADGTCSGASTVSNGAACQMVSYTITLNAHNGTGGTSVLYAAYDWDTYLDSEHTQIMYPNCNDTGYKITPPTRTGYTFNGYYSAASGGQQYAYDTGCLTSDGYMYKDNPDYAVCNVAEWHAQWTAQTSTVTLNANGGTAGTTTSVTATYDSAMPVPTNNTHIPTRAGYTFAGFYDTSAATGGNMYYKADGTSNKNWDKTGAQTLYARWTQCAANSYCPGDNTTKNCSSQTSSKYTKSAAGSTSINDCYLTLTAGQYVATAGAGATVCGANTWSTSTANIYYGGTVSGRSTTSSCTSCTSGYTTSGDAASNHDAKSDCTISITLNKNGGTAGSGCSVATSVTCQEGVACSFPDGSCMTQTGYTFAAGWSTSSGTGASNCVTSATTPTTTTYYACKTANTYNITYELNGGTSTPSGYTPVEYIQGTGAAYINTGFKPSGNFMHEMVFATTTNSGTNLYICGTGASNGRGGNVRISGGKFNGIYIGTSSAVSILSGTPTVAANTRHTLVLNLNHNATSTAYFNGTNIANTSTSTVTSTDSLLLGQSGAGTAGWPIKIYHDAISLQGSMVRDFIPVRNSSNVCGLYDIINGAFYSSASSTAFTCPSTTAYPANYTYAIGASVVGTPARANSTFAGWCTDAALTDCAATQTVSTTDNGNKTFYAKWTCNTGYTANAAGTACVANTYTVVYNANKPSAATANVSGSTASSSHTYGTAKNLTSNGYTLTGWTFQGWSTSASSSTVAYTNGQSVISLTATNGATVNLYAVWTQNCNAITLNANEGTAGSVTTLYKKTDATGWYSNNTCTTAYSTTTNVKPTRSGYTFRGFYSADLADVTSDNSSGTQYITTAGATTTAGTNWTVNAPTSIYAAWATNCPSSVANGTCSLSVSTAGAVDYTTTCSTGYTISGNNTSNPSCAANCNAITLNPNEGTAGSTTTLYKKTDATGWYSNSTCTTAYSTTTNVKPTRSGYTFRGFYSADLADVTSDNSSGTQYITTAGATTTAGTNWTVNAPATIYAAWATNCPSSVTNGSCSLSVSTAGAVDYTTSCNTGYTISGNNTSSPSCAANCNAITVNNTTRGGSTSNTTLYKLTDGTAWYSNNTCSTAVTTTPRPSKTNATFSGYYTAADNTTTNVGSSASPSVLSTTWTVNAATTIYAHYDCNANYRQAGTDIAGTCTNSIYAITLRNYNDSATDATIYEKYAAGWYSNSGATTALSAATIPTRSGYKFRGYYTAKQTDLTANGGSGTRRITNASTGNLPGNTTFTAATTLYAAWAKDCTQPDHGTCSLTINSDGTATYSASCDTGYTVSNATTATPTCTAQTSTVTLKNGSTTVDTVTATYDAAMPTKNTSNANLTMPTSTKAVFLGYYDATTGGTQYYTAALASARTWNKTGAQTLNAQFASCTCNAIGQGVSSCTPSGVSENKCQYSVTCSAGYSQSGGTPSTRTFTATNPTAAVATYMPNCVKNSVLTVTLDSKYYASASATSGTAVTTNAAPTTIYEWYDNGWWNESEISTAFTALTTKPAYTTYVFGGFYTGKAGTGDQIIDASGNLVSGTEKKFTANGTIYAKWTACTCGTDTNATCEVMTTSNNTCQYKHTCAAGYYNANNGATGTSNTMTCTKCTAGKYCPDGATSESSCPTNWSSDAGASLQTQCYRNIVMNKNGMSGTLTLPSGSGCKSIGGATGATNDTLVVYYNTACTLPTTALSGTATGTTYTGTTSWATNANAASGFVTSITTTSTDATITYYAGKKYTCAAGYYLTANTNGACTACPDGSYCPGVSNVYYSNIAQGRASCTAMTDTLYNHSGTGSADAIARNDIGDCYATTTAGKYIAEANANTETTCPASFYCPSASVYWGTTGSKLNCNTATADGTAETPWTSDAGATARTSCYRDVTLSKNSMSGTLTLPANSGCKSYTSNEGTTSDVVTVYYNTACKLPDSTALSRAASGTTSGLNGDGKWSLSATATSSTTGTNALRDTVTITGTGDSIVYYAGRKMSCNAGYYLAAKATTACTSCTAGYYCTGTAAGYYSTSIRGRTSTCAAGIATGWTSKAGAPSKEYCYYPVTVNKNGYSFTIAAGTFNSTTRNCIIDAQKTGTTAATLRLYWNADCTLPSVGSRAQTGYTNGTAWAASNAIDAETITTLAKVSDNSVPAITTIYVQKPSCAANYYKSAASTCSLCSGVGDGGYNKSVAGNKTDEYVCYAAVTLNKNNYSGSITAPENSGCEIDSNSGTTNATLHLHYNTACTLPTIAQTTQSPYIFEGLATSANIGAAAVSTSIAASTENPAVTTYYVRKIMCADNSYKSGDATCAACPTAYPNNAAGTSSQDACYLTTTATKYVATAGAGQVNCAAGGYCPGGVVIYYSGTHSSEHPTTGGRTACPANSYCVATVSAPTSCATTNSKYPKSAAESDDANDCYLTTTATKYVAEVGAGEVACVAGGYCAGGSDIYVGGTVSGRNTTGGIAVCADNTYSAASASSCTACATANGYTNSGSTYADHATIASCTTTCAPGQYVATAGAACANVGAGNWGEGGTVAQNATLPRTACATGLTTIGYGMGADAAADCGHKFHVGENIVYLRSVKRTNPSLNVKIGGTTFYGNMGTTERNMSVDQNKKLKVKDNGTIYYVYDDSIGQEPEIPSDYTVVPYISTNSNAYIDTTMTVNSFDRVVTNVKLYDYKTETGKTDYPSLFGATANASSGSNNAKTFRFYNNGASFTCSYGDTWGSSWSTPPSGSFPLNAFTDLDVKLAAGEQYIKINGVTKAAATLTKTLTNNYNVTIFAFNYAGNKRYKPHVDCKGMTFYKGDDVVLNLVPVRRNSDSKCGMYDTVHKTFYGSAISTNFTCP